MGRRRRRLSAEEQDKAAREELERAKSALSYRKGQLAEAEEELRSLRGVGGWLAAIVGKRAGYEAELNTKISALNKQLVTDRKALIEARQAVARFDDKARAAEAEQQRRTAELEVLAERIRGRTHHPIHTELTRIDGELDALQAELVQFTRAWEATARLTEALNRAARGAERAKMGGFGEQDQQQSVRDAAMDFNFECNKIGLARLNIEIPDLPSAWAESEFESSRLGYQSQQRRIAARFKQFLTAIESERAVVTETLLFVGGRRKEVMESIEAKKAERRALLESAS